MSYESIYNGHSLVDNDTFRRRGVGRVAPGTNRPLLRPQVPRRVSGGVMRLRATALPFHVLVTIVFFMVAVFAVPASARQEQQATGGGQINTTPAQPGLTFG